MTMINYATKNYKNSLLKTIKGSKKLSWKKNELILLMEETYSKYLEKCIEGDKP